MKRLTLIDKAFLLKKTLLFGSLDLDLLLSIADKLNTVAYEPNEQIFAVNEEANRMYLIYKGEVEIRNAVHSRLAILSSSDFFGEESLFNDKPRGYEVLSLTNTHLFTLSRTNLFTIISECPSVAVSFLQAYTSAIDFRPSRSIDSPERPLA